MAIIFYKIYKATKAHPLWSLLLLLAFTGLSIFSALQLKFEENILDIMPQDEAATDVNDVLEGLDVNKRLVVHVYTDSVKPSSADTIISKATQFSKGLEEKSADNISAVRLEMPDAQLRELYDFFYKNLPFYLQSEDYALLDEQVSSEGTATAVRQIYKSLMSPMGVVTGPMLVKDPYGMVRFPLERMKGMRLDDHVSLYKNHLFSNDHRHLIFFVEIANLPSETSKNSELIEVMDSLAIALRTDHIEIEYFGTAAVAVANAHQIKSDIQLTVTLALVGLFFFITFFFRRVGVFFLVVTPGVFGGIVAAGLLSLLNDQVSVISLAVGSVLLGITIDYALHLFTHAKKEKDIKQLFEDLTTPILLSSVTTACAFLSLLFIRSSALQNLGFFAGMSVIFAALYTLIVLPHFLKYLPKSEGNQPNWVEKLIGFIANGDGRINNRYVLLFVVVFSIVCLFFWRNVKFEENMLGLNYMPAELARNEANINEISNYSVNHIYVANHGVDLWAALEANAPLRELLDSLKADKLINDYVMLNEAVPSLAEQTEGLKKWEHFWQSHGDSTILNGLEVEAMTMGFKEDIFASFDSTITKSYTLMDVEDLSGLFDVIGKDLIISKGDSMVLVLSVIKVSLENKAAVLTQLDALPGLIVLERGKITAQLVALLQEDFSRLVNISILLVFAVIWFSYGRIELALITFIPIALSWLWVLGIMGYFGLTFNIVNVIVCTFVFGLGVDYSVFVMRGLTQKYSTGVDNLLSYKKSILLSVITTLLGIGVLAFAKHPALRSIASLSIIGILSVVVITFTVEVTLYNLIIGNRGKNGRIPYTLASLFYSFVAFTVFFFGCISLQLVVFLMRLPIGSKKGKRLLLNRLISRFAGFIVWVMGNFKTVTLNKENANFEKPAVIIANHHSFLDILLLLMQHPRMVMVTNDWVYYSPFFGKVIQRADFISASMGIENQLGKIQNLVNEGYSIIVFPEGSRSPGFKLRRFHKGAFYLAEVMNLDIQPIVLHGTNLIMPKEDGFCLKNNTVTLKYLPRIKPSSFGKNYSEQTRNISSHFKQEYAALREELESPYYFKEVLIKNYLYKGPILEWYVKIKLRLEQYYALYNDIIPKQAKIVDLGCGYGMMTYSLGLNQPGRIIHGVDYDGGKIAVADNCPVHPANITFSQADVMTYAFEPTDVFLLSDVLHYLTVIEQEELLEKIAKNTKVGGMFVIRDGDRSKTERHKGTRMTEFFSTNFGFNKVRNEMNYISSDMIEHFAEKNGFDLEIIDVTKRTSNVLFVLKKKG